MSETMQSATATETKNTKGKAQKKAARTKAGAPKCKTAKVAKVAKPKPEKTPKAPREDRTNWGTFALRLPVAERDAIHAASGAAGASRFARIVLNAFSNDDTAAFEAAIAEARKLR
jgi:hypothetical protein